MLKPSGKMSFVDAAEFILRQKNNSMHIKEITKETLRRALVQTKGKTPQRTLSVAVYLENKRREKHNLPLRFQKTGPDIWSLVNKFNNT